MINVLNNFSNVIGNNIWLALLMALVGGVVSSFSPCCLSTVPLVIGYVGGYAGKDRRLALTYSLIFSLGIIVTFTALGAISAVLGKLFTGTGKWWYLILGAIMLLVGLQLLEVIKFGVDSCKLPQKRKGIAGAFFLGILGGVMASPCSTPVLIAILAFVASKGNLALGIGMLLLYSVGHCTLVMIAGTSVGFVQQLAASEKTYMAGKVLKVVLAIIVLIIGLYLIYLGF